MQTLRVHDPGRRPANWTDIIRAGQFAAFAKDLATGAACDLDGRPFPDPADASCAVFDSFHEARGYSESSVLRAPGIRIDIFDAQGRAHAPLLTVLHPDRSAALESDPRAVGRRRVLAWCLLIGALPLFALAYVWRDTTSVFLLAFIGVNMLLFGGRLLWFNLGLRETERVRQERLKNLDAG